MSYKQTFEDTDNFLATMETGLGRDVLKMKEAFDQARKELRLANLDKFQRSRLNVEALEAARADLVDLVAQEKSIVEAALAAERRRFERDSELNRDQYRDQVRNYERHLSALSEKEITEEANRVLTGQVSRRPEELDVLSASLKASDPELFGVLRDEVKTKDLYSPWRHTPDGRKIVQYLDTIDAALKHGGEIPIREKETGQTYNILLDQVLGTLEAE